MTEVLPPELARLRDCIDELDREMVATLARRQRLVEAVALVKGDPSRVRDPERVEAVLANVLQAAAIAGLSAAIAEPIWRLLVERCADREVVCLSAGPATYANACCGCQAES